MEIHLPSKHHCGVKIKIYDKSVLG